MVTLYRNPNDSIASASGGGLLAAPTQEEFEACCCCSTTCGIVNGCCVSDTMSGAFTASFSQINTDCVPATLSDTLDIYTPNCPQVLLIGGADWQAGTGACDNPSPPPLYRWQWGGQAVYNTTTNAWDFTVVVSWDRDLYGYWESYGSITFTASISAASPCVSVDDDVSWSVAITGSLPPCCSAGVSNPTSGHVAMTVSNP